MRCVYLWKAVKTCSRVELPLSLVREVNLGQGFRGYVGKGIGNRKKEKVTDYPQSWKCFAELKEKINEILFYTKYL